MVPPTNEPNGFWGEDPMRFVKGVAPFVMTLAVVAVTTVLLLYFKLAGAGPHHPIFLYLLPIALVAFLFGSMPATLFAIVAIFCSVFFLYDPIYSFRVANPREFGDLICFMILALMTVKCSVELLRPIKAPAPASPRFGRP
jgi:K+-sensing histidine kinase KdpD